MMWGRGYLGLLLWTELLLAGLKLPEEVLGRKAGCHVRTAYMERFLPHQHMDTTGMGTDL